MVLSCDVYEQNGRMERSNSFSFFLIVKKWSEMSWKYNDEEQPETGEL